MSDCRHIESIEQDLLFALTGRARGISCTNVAHFQSNVADCQWIVCQLWQARKFPVLQALQVGLQKLSVLKLNYPESGILVYSTFDHAMAHECHGRFSPRTPPYLVTFAHYSSFSRNQPSRVFGAWPTSYEILELYVVHTFHHWGRDCVITW